MRSRLFFCLFILPALLARADTGHAAGRRFTLQDDIEMAQIIEPKNDGNAPLKYSPDGRYVAVVTERSTFESNAPQDTILVFEVERIQQYLRAGRSERLEPIRLASMSGYKDGPHHQQSAVARRFQRHRLRCAYPEWLATTIRGRSAVAPRDGADTRGPECHCL